MAIAHRTLQLPLLYKMHLRCEDSLKLLTQQDLMFVHLTAYQGPLEISHFLDETHMDFDALEG